MSIAIMYVIFNFHVLEHIQFLDSTIEEYIIIIHSDKEIIK